MNEMIAARDEILLCGVGLAAIGGLLWLLFLRLFARLAVMSLLVLSSIALLLASALCALRGGLISTSSLQDLSTNAANALDQVEAAGSSHLAQIDGASDASEKAFDSLRGAVSGSTDFLLSNFDVAESAHEASIARWAAFTFGIIGLLYIVLLCVLRDAIRSVIAIVQEATKVVAYSPTLLLVPFATLVTMLYILSHTLTTVVLLLTSSPTARDGHRCRRLLHLLRKGERVRRRSDRRPTSAPPLSATRSRIQSKG